MGLGFPAVCCGWLAKMIAVWKMTLFLAFYWNDPW
jgi:hypothetical protein